MQHWLHFNRRGSCRSLGWWGCHYYWGLFFLLLFLFLLLLLILLLRRSLLRVRVRFSRSEIKIRTRKPCHWLQYWSIGFNCLNWFALWSSRCRLLLLVLRCFLVRLEQVRHPWPWMEVRHWSRHYFALLRFSRFSWLSWFLFWLLTRRGHEWVQDLWLLLRSRNGLCWLASVIDSHRRSLRWKSILFSWCRLRFLFYFLINWRFILCLDLRTLHRRDSSIRQLSWSSLLLLFKDCCWFK